MPHKLYDMAHAQRDYKPSRSQPLCRTIAKKFMFQLRMPWQKGKDFLLKTRLMHTNKDYYTLTL